MYGTSISPFLTILPTIMNYIILVTLYPPIISVSPFPPYLHVFFDGYPFYSFSSLFKDTTDLFYYSALSILFFIIFIYSLFLSINVLAAAPDILLPSISLLITHIFPLFFIILTHETSNTYPPLILILPSIIFIYFAPPWLIGVFYYSRPSSFLCIINNFLFLKITCPRCSSRQNFTLLFSNYTEFLTIFYTLCSYKHLVTHFFIISSHLPTGLSNFLFPSTCHMCSCFFLHTYLLFHTFFFSYFT